MQPIANNLFAQALPYILQTLGAVGILVVSWLGTLAAKYVKNATARGIIDRAIDAAAAVVGEVQQTVVSKIQTNGVPLTEAQIVAVKDAALAQLKEHLGPQGIAELQGVVEPGTLNAKLVTWLEAAVANMNATKPPILMAATLEAGSGGFPVRREAGAST